MASGRILWSERDAGRKFSMIMFGLCLVASMAFMIFAGFRGLEKGDWWAMVGPVGFVLSIVSLIIDWRRRHAR